MNDGEFVGECSTKEEAMELRQNTQWQYISRWCNVYEVCYSKCTGFRSVKKLC